MDSAQLSTDRGESARPGGKLAARRAASEVEPAVLLSMMRAKSRAPVLAHGREPTSAMSGSAHERPRLGRPGGRDVADVPADGGALQDVTGRGRHPFA
jgi:hypothetical protein